MTNELALIKINKEIAKTQNNIKNAKSKNASDNELKNLYAKLEFWNYILKKVSVSE